MPQVLDPITQLLSGLFSLITFVVDVTFIILFIAVGAVAYKYWDTIAKYVFPHWTHAPGARARTHQIKTLINTFCTCLPGDFRQLLEPGDPMLLKVTLVMARNIPGNQNGKKRLLYLEGSTQDLQSVQSHGEMVKKSIVQKEMGDGTVDFGNETICLEWFGDEDGIDLRLREQVVNMDYSVHPVCAVCRVPRDSIEKYVQENAQEGFHNPRAGTRVFVMDEPHFQSPETKKEMNELDQLKQENEMLKQVLVEQGMMQPQEPERDPYAPACELVLRFELQQPLSGTLDEHEFSTIKVQSFDIHSPEARPRSPKSTLGFLHTELNLNHGDSLPYAFATQAVAQNYSPPRR